MADFSQRMELVNKFKGEVDQADWEMLAPHHERGALFIVSKDADLFEVATSLALDEVQAVKSYLDLEHLRKSNDADLKLYGRDKNKFFANFVVVQPYVLFQPY